MGLDIRSLLLRRSCSAGSDSSDCEKPTSQILINVVPTAIMCFVILVSMIVLVILSRRRKKLDALEDAKAGHSLEIDDYDPPARPGEKQPQVSMVPADAQQRPPQLTLTVPPPAVARDRSPSPRSFDTEFDKSPYYHASFSHASNVEPEMSAEAIAKMTQKERHIV